MQLTFDNYDALSAAASGWSFEFVQLDKGQFSGLVEQVDGNSVGITHFCFNRRFRQLGQISEQARTFALFLAPTPFRWLGREFGGDDLCLFPADGAFECVSEPGFDAASITIRDGLLESVAELHQLDTQLEQLPKFGHGIRIDPRRTQAIRVALRALIGSGASSPVIEHTLARLILEALGPDCGDAHRVPRRARDRAYREALDLIHGERAQRLSVVELCVRTGVSERTMRNAFQEHLGVSPKRYLQAVSLRSVRDRLLRGEVDGVLDIAASFGFTHSGQFARDYRAMFGELPSQTRLRTAG